MLHITSPGRYLTGLPLLQLIGEQLHRDEFPKVFARGKVWPRNTPGAPQDLGNLNQEVTDDSQRLEAWSQRSTTGSWAGSTGDGATGTARPRRTVASILGRADVSAEVIEHLEGLLREYLQFRLRLAPPVIYVTGDVTPIDGLSDTATVVATLPLTGSLIFGGWAWWDGMIWIGPRHTNYGNGGVCSFDSTNTVLQCENPFLRQMDIISIWIVRQMHLRYFDFWPGPQTLHTAHERLTEHRPGELCGCGSTTTMYELCHKPVDELLTNDQRREQFERRFPDATRKPPISEKAIAELYNQATPKTKRMVLPASPN